MNSSPAKRSVVIDGHICGLPGVGFGGYVAGLLATELGGPTKVDFIRPAPLGIELSIEHNLASGATLLHDANVLAVGRSHQTTEDHPAPPPWGEAVLASEAYVAMTDNDYPNCFGCGPALPDGKDMRVFTGPIKGRDLVAGAWSPSGSFAAANGVLLPQYVWSALDCPGGRARRQFISREPAVTAYLSVQQRRRFWQEPPTSLPDGRYDRMVGNHSSAWRSLTETVSYVPSARRSGSPRSPESELARSGHPTLPAGRDTPCPLVITGKPLTHRSGRSCCRERPR
jgi:hypothetical protein